MYQALGIMTNRTDDSLCPYWASTPVGGYFNMSEGGKCHREKQGMGGGGGGSVKGHVVEGVDGSFEQSGERKLHRVNI